MFTGRETIILLMLIIAVFYSGYLTAKTKDIYRRATKDTLNGTFKKGV